MDMIATIGTSDQPYWLAETCKILLLLVLLLLQASAMEAEFPCLSAIIAVCASRLCFTSLACPVRVTVSRAASEAPEALGRELGLPLGLEPRGSRITLNGVICKFYFFRSHLNVTSV